MKHGKWFALIVLCAFALGMVACGPSAKEKEAAEKAAIAAKAAEKNRQEELAKQEAEAKRKAEEAAKAADPECWGKADPAAPKVEFEAAGVKYEVVQNYRLNAVGADPAKELTLGVITDIKNNIPQNEKILADFIKTFKKEGATAIVVTGDTSEEYEGLKGMFEFLAKQGMLTLVVMGNREKKDDYIKAATEVAAAYKNFINMNRIRLANLGPATLFSLAGYHDPNYIHHPPGCAYTKFHIDEAKKLVAEAKNPVVLVTHGPPRGSEKTSIDYAVEAGNVGDSKLNQLLTEANIPFGVFGNIHEAGGKAVGPDFKTPLEQGKPAAKLYLNPGPADSDPWTMNDGTISRGMAAVLKIKGAEASYKILHAPGGGKSK